MQEKELNVLIVGDSELEDDTLEEEEEFEDAESRLVDIIVKLGGGNR